MPIHNKNVKKSNNVSYTGYGKDVSPRNPKEFLELMVNNTNYKSVFKVELGIKQVAVNSGHCGGKDSWKGAKTFSNEVR